MSLTVIKSNTLRNHKIDSRITSYLAKCYTDSLSFRRYSEYYIAYTVITIYINNNKYANFEFRCVSPYKVGKSVCIPVYKFIIIFFTKSVSPRRWVLVVQGKSDTEQATSILFQEWHDPCTLEKTVVNVRYECSFVASYPPCLFSHVAAPNDQKVIYECSFVVSCPPCIFSHVAAPNDQMLDTSVPLWPVTHLVYSLM